MASRRLAVKTVRSLQLCPSWDNLAVHALKLLYQQLKSCLAGAGACARSLAGVRVRLLDRALMDELSRGPRFPGAPSQKCDAFCGHDAMRRSVLCFVYTSPSRRGRGRPLTPIKYLSTNDVHIHHLMSYTYIINAVPRTIYIRFNKKRQ